VTISPYDSQRITFTVKPDTVYPTEVAWKCKVNDGKTVFESDFNNNEAMNYFMISEEEEEPSYLILIVIIVIILIIVIALIGFFVYKRIQSAEMAKCSNCSGLVPLDATVCPHCGVEFSDELECECGEPVPKGSTECPACGKPVSPMGDLESDEEVEDEEELQELEDDEVDTEEEEGTSEIEEMEGEEYVEEEIEEEIVPKDAEADEELAECFECGALIPVSAPICPHCGAVFE
jgi:RNA polymerase subunit RPABC4/transcription elongation factor Spt4